MPTRLALTADSGLSRDFSANQTGTDCRFRAFERLQCQPDWHWLPISGLRETSVPTRLALTADSEPSRDFRDVVTGHGGRSRYSCQPLRWLSGIACACGKSPSG